MPTLTAAQLVHTHTAARLNSPVSIAALAAGVGVAPDVLWDTYPPVGSPDLRLEETEKGARVSLPDADLRPIGVEVPHWLAVLIHCVRDSGTPGPSAGRRGFSLRAAAEILYSQGYRMGGSRSVAQLEAWLTRAIPTLDAQGPRLNERGMVVMA